MHKTYARIEPKKKESNIFKFYTYLKIFFAILFKPELEINDFKAK
jgi:hypothetical protein